MPATSLYAQPRRNLKLDDCFFYHCMDLPACGEVGTQWDLRSVTDSYLGNVDFTGKRVLDVGAASGYLTFEMEARGAEVVSFDMADGEDWNLVPYPSLQQSWQEAIAARRVTSERLKNAYWFAHEKLNSRARACYGDIYRLPDELGQFDVVLFGMILGHLRDPFQALYSGSRLCSGQIIVTNQTPSTRRHQNLPLAVFAPDRDGATPDFWWALSDACIDRMLAAIGFDLQQRVAFDARCIVEGRRGDEACAATVTQRVAGEAAARKAA